MAPTKPTTRTRAKGASNEHRPSYGLWGLVIVNSAVFILFAYSFFKPQTSRDWRSFGAFSAFLVALFTEMYGFPLTIYFLSGGCKVVIQASIGSPMTPGHLLEMIFGWKSNPHFGPFHVLSFLFIGGGFILIAKAWRVLITPNNAKPWLPPVRTATCGTLNMSASSWSCSDFCFNGRHC